MLPVQTRHAAGGPDKPITASAAPSPWVHGETEASSALLMAIGGLETEIKQGRSPQHALEGLANKIQATVDATSQYGNAAQPPPSDYMAMFRLVDYFDRTNGDV